LFPMSIWDQNVKLIVPRASSSKTLGINPIMLALNRDKLTHFQTIKAFQKTRKLIIQQGMQQQVAQLNEKFATSKPLNSATQVVKNPHVLKMRPLRHH